MGNRAHWTV